MLEGVDNEKVYKELIYALKNPCTLTCSEWIYKSSSLWPKWSKKLEKAIQKEIANGGQLVYKWEPEENESISVYDAALIWESNGKDEDYTFGYSEEELEAAL